MISQETIEKVLDRADIVDVVSEYVELTKKGGKYVACCPFHNEKTPSFVVSPARNTWHCFGACQEGGNAVSFLMKQGLTFVESIEKLATKYGITIEKGEPPSAEETQHQAKLESIYIINERVAAYFCKNLQSKEGEAARSYVESRWGNEFANEMGIGFALGDWSNLYTFALKSSLSVELMIEIGLLNKASNGNMIDAYRNRVMIPIRDKYRRVLGFTARDLSGEETAPKYINSKTSDVYSKEDSIFGIDVAIKQAVKEDKIYCVEGAPDVLRLQSIGINNAVAALGGSWTVKQLRQLKRLVTKLCILPDADPPKNGKTHGTGIELAFRNGALAMKEGFAVSIKEIPLGDNGEKNDPDTCCKSKAIFKLLEEEEFIYWYARHNITQGLSSVERSNLYIEICDMILAENDELQREIRIEELASRYPPKSTWKKALSCARDTKQREKKAATPTIDKNLFEKYGFHEENNTYYGITKDGGFVSWSNFSMLPLFHIKDNLLPKRLYKIKNSNKQEEIIELKQEDLVSLAKFKQRIEGLGNYIWLASEKELTKLKMFLYEQTETATEVTQLGWQSRGNFYAFGNGAFTTEWHPADEYGIVRLDGEKNYYLPSASKIYKGETSLFQFERKFVHLNLSGVSLNEYCKQMIDVSGENAKIGICFFIATLFRDIITGYTKSFPILNLFGPKGSGKSELGHSLMAFFIIGNTPPNICNSTIAALADVVAQCSNALVHIDEYKNSLERDKNEFLKGLWDGAGRSRMNMDRDKKREITSVDCGVILSGQEMPTADIALFSRLVYLTFNKSEFTSEQKAKFNKLVETRKHGLTHLTLQILRHRAKVEQGFSSNFTQCMEDVSKQLGDTVVEDRIFRNWVIPLAAFRTLEAVLDVPFGYKELLDITVKGIVKQNGECKSNNELANFWNVVSYLQQNGEIFFESDYRIDYTNEFKSQKAKEPMRFMQSKPILKLRKNRVFMLYKKYGKMVGENTLPESSLEYYLENSNEFMGKQNSVRFKDIQKGYEVAKVMPIGSGVTAKKQSAVSTALCFDYEKIMESYGINLEVIYETETNMD